MVKLRQPIRMLKFHCEVILLRKLLLMIGCYFDAQISGPLVRGSVAQWLASLLLEPAAPGSNPSGPKIFSEEKLLMLLGLIQGAA